MFVTKRVYEAPEPTDGVRFLVERLWPRGIKKESLQIQGWLKQLAPSDSLRRWFNHDPVKWSEFQSRYFAELDQQPDAWKPLIDIAQQQPKVTLLYSARDTAHNNAVALRSYLERHRAEQ